jgi:hypothetical protein
MRVTVRKREQNSIDSRRQISRGKLRETPRKRLIADLICVFSAGSKTRSLRAAWRMESSLPQRVMSRKRGREKGGTGITVHVLPDAWKYIRRT